MNQYAQLIVFIVVLGLSPLTYAENSYWQCTVKDKEEKQWIEKNSYKRVAITKAIAVCKKQSTAPTTCKPVNESCEYFSNGLSVTPLWRCMALDQMSKAWYSNFHTNRDDAAIESRVFCQEHSSMPDSCYINLMTCKNVNER